MNNVISFRPGNSSRRIAPRESGAAQILFFTGVRYQRWTDEAHDVQPQAQGSRRKNERAQIGAGGRERKSRR
jgi:hypothetical protein